MAMGGGEGIAGGGMAAAPVFVYEKRECMHIIMAHVNRHQRARDDILILLSLIPLLLEVLYL